MNLILLLAFLCIVLSDLGVLGGAAVQECWQLCALQVSDLDLHV